MSDTAHYAACIAELNARVKASEATITKLRNALSGLLGASTKEELDQLELVIRLTPAPEADKIAVLNAIHALQEALPTSLS